MMPPAETGKPPAGQHEGPRLASCDLRFVPARVKSQVGVLNSLAQTKPTEFGSKTSLREGEVAHWETQDALNR